MTEPVVPVHVDPKPLSPAQSKLKLAKRVIAQLEHLSGSYHAHLMGVLNALVRYEATVAGADASIVEAEHG